MLKKKDVILIAAVFSALILAFFVFKNSYKKPSAVNVYVDNRLFLTLPFSDTEKTIKTDYGYNILKIENGKVYITAADCDNKTCIKTSPVSKKGESIICAPHRLLVELK